MAILKLQRLDDLNGEPFDPPKYIHLNTDHAVFWTDGKPGLTQVRMVVGPTWNVAISADQFSAAADPENACPDPPGECGYRTHYLAYGGPDLTHAGYHAAVTIHERHAVNCRIYESGRECSLCTSGEQRLRA